jgi:hypothetical protein
VNGDGVIAQGRVLLDKSMLSSYADDDDDDDVTDLGYFTK